MGEIVKGTVKRGKCNPIAGVLAVKIEREKGEKKLSTELGNRLDMRMSKNDSKLTWRLCGWERAPAVNRNKRNVSRRGREARTEEDKLSLVLWSLK